MLEERESETPTQETVIVEEKESIGTTYLWQKGQSRIRIMPAFIYSDCGSFPTINAWRRQDGIGSPRDHIPRQEVFQALANWLIYMGVETICGPVLSGAALAYAIAVASNGNLRATYLPKPHGYYVPKRHGDEPIFRGKYALVDDIVYTGEALKTCLEFTARQCQGQPAAIIADVWINCPECLSDIKDRLFTVIVEK